LYGSGFFRSLSESWSGAAIFRGSYSDVRLTPRECLFLAYANDIWRNIVSKIRLFADDCIIYGKILNNNDIEKLQRDLDRLGDWALENEMK
jgi:hypothetical protein